MTSISAERSGLAKVGMTLRRREQWGARRSYTDARSVSEPATKQFVHITVTSPGNYNSFDAHARAIEAIGIARFSRTGVSYNRLFMAGTRNVYEAQPIGRRGAHTVNDFRRSSCSTSGCPSRGTSLSAPSWNLNVNARAYAYASNVGFSVPDHVIDDMARTMAADRLAGFVTRNATIHGHRCVSAKSCPGDRMWERMHDLERRVEHYLSNGLGADMALDKDDVRTIARTDGVFDAPPDSPGAKSGKNKHWHLNSLIRNVVNHVLYRKDLWWKVRLPWFGSWTDHEGTEERYPDGYTAQANLSHAHRYARENNILLREMRAEAAAFHNEVLERLEEMATGERLSDEQVQELAERFAGRVRAELDLIQVTVGIEDADPAEDEPAPDVD